MEMLKDAAPVGTILQGIYDLALKLQEILQAGNAHNDQKPDNVILETSALGAVRPCAIDLGLCTRLAESPGFQGDPEVSRHLAPELFQRGVAIAETELFSLGFLLCVVLGTYFSSSARTASWPTRRRPWSAPTRTNLS